MTRWPVVLLFLVMSAIAAAAQDEPAFERVALRVIDVRPGSIVVVDRGTSDGLARGDRVVFHPRAGGVHSGRERLFPGGSLLRVLSPAPRSARGRGPSDGAPKSGRGHRGGA